MTLAELDVSHLSTETISVPFTANVDPDTISCELAVVAANVHPADDDWHTATIDGGVATLLVGPSGGAVTLEARRRYAIWARIQDTPEVPVEKTGIIVTY